MTASGGPQPNDGVLRLAPAPRVDFAAFGPVETRPLSKIQKLTGAYLARNWATIPHVFHQDEADITDLETVRTAHAAGHPEVKITPLAFIVKATALTLLENPTFNASLDAENSQLVLKKYVHIGIAVDTPNGLVVAVVRDCDKRPVEAIATDIASLSSRAREKGLPMTDMVGGCFTVSSLGRQGGTGFTPIINAPEVAILGVSRTLERPARDAQTGGVAWRQVLPLSLSYDHRVVNGVDAARFMTGLRARLAAPAALVG